MTWRLDPEGARCRLRLTENTPDIGAAMAEGHIVGLHHHSFTFRGDLVCGVASYVVPVG